MGSWDEGIMGGDTPWDILGCIEDVIGGSVTAQQINDHLDDILNIIHEKQEYGEIWSRKDRRTFSQVVGFQIVTSGAKFPARLKNRVIKACESEILDCKNDKTDWLRPGKRINRLESFIKDVQRYNGKPLKIRET